MPCGCAHASTTARSATKRTPASRKPPPAPRPDIQAQRRLEQLELRLETTLAERDALEARLADPALYAEGGALVAELTQRHADLTAEIAACEAEWLQLTARLEAKWSAAEFAYDRSSS